MPRRGRCGVAGAARGAAAGPGGEEVPRRRDRSGRDEREQQHRDEDGAAPTAAAPPAALHRLEDGEGHRAHDGTALHFDPCSLRDLPSVDELARGVDDPLAVEAARAVLERAREEIRAGRRARRPRRSALREELAAARRPSLRRVLNATGVIVHTNLGRAPLAPEALERVREVGGGYSNLEYDLDAGARGSRQEHVDRDPRAG